MRKKKIERERERERGREKRKNELGGERGTRRTSGKRKAWIVTERAAAGLVIINSEKRIAVKARLPRRYLRIRTCLCARARKGTRILIDHLRLHGASRRCTSSSHRGMIRLNRATRLSCHIYIYARSKRMNWKWRADGRRKDRWFYGYHTSFNILKTPKADPVR